MSVSLQRLAGPASLSSGDNTVFSGTAGHTYLITAILIVSNTSAAAKRTVKIGIGGVTDALLISPTIGIPRFGEYNRPRRDILEGGEDLHVNTDGTGLTCTVYGLDIT